MSVEVSQERLSQGLPVLLDGGLGEVAKAQMQEIGGSIDGPLWATTALFTPEGRQIVTDIHGAYLEAGSDVVGMGTFRALPGWFVKHELERLEDSSLPKAEMNGVTNAHELSRWAIATAGKLAVAAREESGRTGVLIAGSWGPLEDCYKPNETPSDYLLAAEYAHMAESFAESGADLVSIETFPSIRGSIAAARAAQEAGLRYGLSWWGSNGGIGHKETFAQAVRQIEKHRLTPEYVGFNCVDLKVADIALGNLIEVAGGRPIAISANGNRDPRDHNSCDNAEYFTAAERWLETGKLLDAGALLIGGCCGTTPETIQALAPLFKPKSPITA